MKFLNVPLFLISLAVGIFMTYVYTPHPRIIYVYPTPDNIGRLQYKDKNGMCFKFGATELNCPADKTKIQKYPMQDGVSH